MSTFRLDKPEEEVRRVGFVLEKQGIHERILALVGLNIDVSGSMKDQFGSGAVQSALERVLPVALYFDDDASVDAWVFADSERVAQIASADASNYRGFVEREILRKPEVMPLLWGGTDYAPAIRANLTHYGLLGEEATGGFLGRIFGRTRETLRETTRLGLPAINYFLTDGENTDADQARALLQRAEEAEAQIYYVMVGIGSERFTFLQEAAAAFPNVGFVRVDDLGAFAGSDDAYARLLPAELCEWLRHEHEEGEDHHG